MTIDQLNIIAQSLEAVRESFGYEQGAIVAGRKMFTVPSQEGLRSSPEIDCNVKDFATDATH
jgi:hypothetical protein